VRARGSCRGGCKQVWFISTALNRIRQPAASDLKKPWERPDFVCSFQGRLDCTENCWSDLFCALNSGERDNRLLVEITAQGGGDDALPGREVGPVPRAP